MKCLLRGLAAIGVAWGCLAWAANFGILSMLGLLVLPGLILVGGLIWEAAERLSR